MGKKKIALELVNSVLSGTLSSDNSINLTDSTRHELKKHGLIIGDQIGTGAYADIYYGRYKKNRVAIKMIDIENVSTRFWFKFLPRELNVLRNLSHHQHPNIIHVYNVFEISSKKLLVMELAEGGTLLEKVEKRGGFFTEKIGRVYFAQIVDGIGYLHRNGLAHRDLKLENILLDSQDRVKIADFGFTRFMRNENGENINSTTFCGTMLYLAPEVLKKLPYNAMRSDIWSLGILLYRMLYGVFPFDSEVTMELIDLIYKRGVVDDPVIDNILSIQVRDLIKSMLQPNPKKRPLIDAIETNQWVSSVRSKRPGLASVVRNIRFTYTDEPDKSDEFFVRIGARIPIVSTIKSTTSRMSSVASKITHVGSKKDDEEDWEKLAKTKKRGRKRIKKMQKKFPSLSKIDATLKDSLHGDKDFSAIKTEKGEISGFDKEKQQLTGKKGNFMNWIRHLKFWSD